MGVLLIDIVGIFYLEDLRLGREGGWVREKGLECFFCVLWFGIVIR